MIRYFVAEFSVVLSRGEPNQLQHPSLASGQRVLAAEHVTMPSLAATHEVPGTRTLVRCGFSGITLCQAGVALGRAPFLRFDSRLAGSSFQTSRKPARTIADDEEARQAKGETLDGART